MNRSTLILAGLLYAGLQAFDGELDSAFGVNGVATTAVASSGFQAAALVKAPYQLITGGTALLDQTVQALLLGYTLEGAVDPALGASGQVLVEVGSLVTSNALLRAGDGKLYLGGSVATQDQAANLLLMRFFPDGSLDQTFGDKGVVQCDFAVPSASYVAQGMVLDRLGRITVTGSSAVEGQSWLLVARFLSDGTLDTSFGHAGFQFLQAPVGSDSYGIQLVQDAQQGLLVAGFSGLALQQQLLFVSLDKHGTILSQQLVDLEPGSQQRLYALVPDEKGACFAVGTITPPNGMSYGFAIRRFASGELDTDFGNNGVATLALSDGDIDLRCATRAPNGKLFVAGRYDTTYLQGIVARFDRTGMLDESFGDQGITLIPPLNAADNAALAGIQVHGQGPIYVTGFDAQDDAVQAATYKLFAEAVACTVDDAHASALARAVRAKYASQCAM